MNNLKVFFIVIGCIIVLGILFYFSQLYYFFYQDVIKTENSVIRHQLPLLLPNAKEDYVSTWGAFGDFIGGTLNPLVGLLSIILLFLTWMVTKQTLEATKTELSESREAFRETAQAQKEIQRTQSLQQFDTIFFSMINNLNGVYSNLNEKNSTDKESEIEKRYRQCFGDNNCGLLERQEFIDDSHELRKYFIILYQIIKNIKSNIQSNKNFDEREKLRLAIFYSNMLRSNLDNKILQLLLLNIYKRFDKYAELLREFRFFEHMDFRNHNEKNYWNFALLQVVVELGEQYFYTSDWYKELQKNKVLKNIFLWRSDFYNKNLFTKNYLCGFLDKNVKIYYECSIVEIRVGSDVLNVNNVRISFVQDGSRFLNTEIDIFRDKFLLKKDTLYYQLYIHRGEIVVSTSENKLNNFLPIPNHKIEII